MTVSESLSVAIFTLIVVIGVLAILFFLIKLFSFVIGNFEKTLFPKEASVESPISESVIEKDEIAEEASEEVFSSGTLRLTNVDEPTAAMIMAIVSDESGIPLSSLCFKSIRLIGE